MKIFVVFAVVVVCVATEDLTPKNKEEWKNVITECIDRNHIPMDEIKKDDPLEYPNDESVRKFLLCIDKQMGFFSSEHGFNVDRFVQQYKLVTGKEEDLREWAEACVLELSQGDMKEDMFAYKMRSCLNRHWRSKTKQKSRFF